jgi:hypothetical protein
MWTLIGGALAAGGSSALNQYIDRELDRHMQRTAKRPLADGRLTDAEGLAFGLGMSLVSYYVLACFVNGLAALLSLAGIVYYVILYSLWLKKATVQNIVIGGGQGIRPWLDMPPPPVTWAGRPDFCHHLYGLLLISVRCDCPYEGYERRFQCCPLCAANWKRESKSSFTPLN